MNASSSPGYCLLIENAEGEKGIDRISQIFDYDPLRIMASAMLNYFSQTGHDMYSAPFGDTKEEFYVLIFLPQNRKAILKSYELTLAE